MLNVCLAGMIVAPGESLKAVFPEGSDTKAWEKAIKAVELKNDVDSIEASIVQVRFFSIHRNQI